MITTHNAEPPSRWFGAGFELACQAAGRAFDGEPPEPGDPTYDGWPDDGHE